jgi:hypothetical protein
MQLFTYMREKLTISETPQWIPHNIHFAIEKDRALSRYNEPLNLQHGPPRPTKDPP